MIAYLLVALLIVIIAFLIAEIIIILVILVVEFTIHVIAKTLELTGLAGEPIDGARDELLLDVLAELVIELEALLNVEVVLIILIKVRRGLGGREEVEEALRGNSSLDDTGLLGVYNVLARARQLR